MNRITRKHLDHLVNCLNTATGSPVDYFSDEINERGNRCTAIGHYCLDWAYNGVQLQRVCNKSGGVCTISDGGYITQRQLYGQLRAILEVLNQCKGA